ncbi:MAG TPA: DinB family protein [Longimicrobium sp.]|nr:DinB family protein [Longimicrobium sp.]
MINQLRRLFAHMRWADERVMEALRRAETIPPQALEIYAHLLAAEHVWLSRLRGQAPRLAVWPVLSPDECAVLAAENEAGFDAYLDELGAEDATRSIAYRNSAGDAFESRVDDVLLHVATHGAYHRGQVALLLRQAGAEPAATDYIAWARGAPAARRT